MDARVQRMLDHFEVSQVVADYAHGCDRGDFVAMAGVFAAESWDDHGHNKCPGREYARRTMARNDEFGMVGHHLGQSLVHVTGDAAGAETWFIAHMRVVEPQGEMLKQIGGRYVDRMVREDGAWKIAHRQVVKEWATEWALADWCADAPFVKAVRGAGDPAGAVLGRVHSGIPGPGGPLPEGPLR